MNTAMNTYCAVAKPEKSRLLEEHLHIVKIIAYQVAGGLPQHIDVNDLISAGMIGLLESVERFDSSRGVQFNTYASIRVRGAIMDELRGMDWMTRSMREKSNQLEKAYGAIEKKTGRPAGEEEVAELMGVSTEEFNALLSEVRSLNVLNLEDMGLKNFDDGMDILECIKDPNGKDPASAMKTVELKRSVAEAIISLPEKERLIISLYYYEELTLKEIGKVLDITESRVCQLHTQTMHRLKSRLREFADG